MLDLSRFDANLLAVRSYIYFKPSIIACKCYRMATLREIKNANVQSILKFMFSTFKASKKSFTSNLKVIILITQMFTKQKIKQPLGYCVATTGTIANFILHEIMFAKIRSWQRSQL